MRRWITLKAVLFILPTLVFAVATTSPRVPSPTFHERENQVSRTLTLTRTSQFVDVRHISVVDSCENVQPPEALATPAPFYSTSARGQKIKVSFIIGTDGRVHSPLILESAGLGGDRRVLKTVRTWRYRPATCNGVPTEIEGKVEFSLR